MKKISEMTDAEILGLTSDDLSIMIKLRMAEEGIKIEDKPKRVELFEVIPCNMSLTKVNILGDNYAFEDFEEAKNIINELRKCKSIFRIDYDYNKASSEYKYASKDLKRGYYGDPFGTSETQAYSIDLYNDVIDLIAQNKKFQAQYDTDIKKWEESFDSAEWIRDEINNKYNEVVEKYERLNRLESKFKNDYLILAPENPEMALIFMSKAYSLNESEVSYIKQKNKDAFGITENSEG